jgi:hypothetical protein
MLSDQETRCLWSSASKLELDRRAEEIRATITYTFPENSPNRLSLLRDLDDLTGEISAFLLDAPSGISARIEPKADGDTSGMDDIRNRFYSCFDESFWQALDDVSMGHDRSLLPCERDSLLASTFEEIVSSSYSVGTPIAEVVVNKGYGVARTIPVFSKKDYLVYFFCVKELEDVLRGRSVATAFGGWGLSEGSVPGNDPERPSVNDEAIGYPVNSSFNPRGWTRAFGAFNNSLYLEIDKGEYSHVFQFDLSNYYDSIRLDTLERWIRAECGPEQCWVVTLLFYFLNQWNRKRTGLHPQDVGLPQDLLADCSRLLSNFYLARYDRYASHVCSEHSACYFRYADDQIVLLRDRSELDKLVLLLTRRLDQYGLRVNQKKVQLWECSEFERHRLRDLHGILDVPRHKRDSERVSQYTTLYLSLSPEQLAASWNGGLPALTRLLWCDLEHLSQRQYNQVLERVTDDDYLERADSGKLKRIYAVCESPEMKSWLVERLGWLMEKLVHNSFHYHVLAFANAFDLEELRVLSHRRLEQLDLLTRSSTVPVFEY